MSTSSDEPVFVVTAFNGRVLAVRVEDGIEAWSVDVGMLGAGPIRLSVQKRQVIATGPREVFVIEYATGDVRQRIPFRGATTMIVDGGIALVSRDGVLACLDLERGIVRWENELPGTGYGAAALGIPGKTIQADAASDRA
jgi:outer membrane protein assembly factor BamB